MQSLAQMRLLTVTALLILLGLSRAEAAATTSNEVAPRKVIYEMVIDDLIDENMDAIRSILWEMDPLDIDDINFPLTNHIYMLLHTGWLQNLSQLQRSGKCTMRYTDKKLNIDLNLGWDDLVFDYRYLIKVLLASRKGDLHGQMTKLNVNIGLEINFKNYHVTLKKFALQEKGKINISLEGHLLDKIYNLVIKAATRLCRTLTLATITEKFKGMIVHRIDEINFQLGSIVNRRQFTFVDLTKSTSYNDHSELMHNAITDNDN